MTPVATSAHPTGAIDGIGSNEKKAAAAPSPFKQAQDTNGTTKKSEIPLVDLYSGSSDSTDADAALRQAIIDGLLGAKNAIVPGDVDSPEDLAFKYSKTLPVTILYDEEGLKIYDELTKVDEYYLFNAELDILERFAPEIVRRGFGFETDATASMKGRLQPHNRSSAATVEFEKGFGPDGAPIGTDSTEEAPNQEAEPNPKHWIHSHGSDLSALSKEKWGDQRVGRFNGGVNAEEGLNALTETTSVDVDQNGHASAPQKASSASPVLNMVELGAGSLRKSIHIVRALANVPSDAVVGGNTPKVIYHALDLDQNELIRTLEDMKRQEGRKADQDTPTISDRQVGLNGLWATYDQGLEFIGKGGLASKDGSTEGRRCFLWLGSSIGNFDRRGAAEFLASARKSALRPGDTMLIGMDRRNDPSEIARAYNDSQGWTNKFIMNGLNHANHVLGANVFDPTKFEYHDRYNDVEGRHESYYRSKVAQTLTIPSMDGSKDLSASLELGELIHVERSHKYSTREALDTFEGAGLRVVQKWTDSTDRYDIWLVESPAFHFPSSTLFTGSRADVIAGLSESDRNDIHGSHEYDTDGRTGWNGIGHLPRNCLDFGCPSLEDWDRMWKAWDTVTLTMIPHEMLFEKPIDLRHLCLFYLGHVPGFTDINIARFLDEPHLNQHFSDIFERGIDPSMETGECSHSHSKVPERPEDWPTVQEIISYRDAVAKRVQGLYEDIAQGRRQEVTTRRFARMLFNVYEHIALHMETLLYMLAQSHKTQPPVGFLVPDWATLARDWEAYDRTQGGEEARNAKVAFKSANVTIGHMDDETEDFGYKIQRATDDIRSINEQLGSPEFGWDVESPARKMHVPAFHITAAPITNEQYAGYMKATGVQKVPASWVSVGESTPDKATDYYVRTIYGPVSMQVARLWPVQASGDELQAYAKWKGGRLPTQGELRRFLDASHGPNCTDRPGTNVGFRNWHPVPPQLAKKDMDGTVLPAHNGGVWEWTSTPLASFDGYKPSDLYPGYSSDFFDGNHLIILGGSWATIPSIAGRRSCVNWYQAQYPYVFAGARVVYDA